MFSFGRKRFDDSGAEFWKWWPGARDGIAKAIVSGAFDDRIVNDITKHVQRVHPQMAWELQPGSQAAHAFCLSPEGNPELRQVALRWLERAPQAGCDVGVLRLEAAREVVDDAHGRRRPVRPRGDAREHGVGRDAAPRRRPAVAPALSRGPRGRPDAGGVPVPGPPARRGRRRALDRRDRAVRGSDRRADPGRAQGRGRAARGRADGRRRRGSTARSRGPTEPWSWSSPMPR